jgi:uncharacterized protein (TIGR00369 family)
MGMSTYKTFFPQALEKPASVSPAADLLGWKGLEVDHEQGRIRVEFQAKPEFTNPIGVIHGGFLTAMLDEAMGGAIAAMLGYGEFAPTVELKVNFIRPAQAGSLVAEGRVVYRGISLAFVQGELRTIDGQLVATGSATAQIQRIRRPAS